MPETTENYFRVPNPAYSGADFKDTARTAPISEEKGIWALWAPLASSGNWKVRTFLFKREDWKSMDDCQAWARDHREDFKGFGVPAVKAECFDVQFPERQTTSPTEKELALINRYALESLSADRVYVRTMDLTNDQWGSHHVRMSRGFQRSIIDSTPGKSLLLGHPQARGLPAIPEGRFFDAEEHRDANGVTWNRAKFYLVKTDQNEHARAQIDGGVWQHASVGMELDWMQCSVCGENLYGDKCRHVPGSAYPRTLAAIEDFGAETVPDDPGKVYCGVTYRGKGQTLEGSIVYWPELKGTAIVAETNLAMSRGDFGAAKRGLLELSGEADALTEGAPTGADLQVSGDPGEPAQSSEEEARRMADEAVLEAARKAAEDKAATLEATNKTLATQVEDLTAKTAGMAGLEQTATTFRAAMTKELDRLAGLVSRETEMATFREAFGADLERMPAEKTLGLIESWTKLFDDAHPGVNRQSTPSDEAGGEPKPEPAVSSRWM